MEHDVAKENAKDKLTKKISQSNKGLPRGVGKAVKGWDALPERAYVNYMDPTNTVFLGDSFAQRANLLQSDPASLAV
jgi:hypothetical protein